MFGIKRKVLKRVRAGLLKRTAALMPENKKRIYDQAGLRMTVKRAFDKMGIKDRGKRQNIHRIMLSFSARIDMLHDFGKFTTSRAASGDQFIQERMRELGAELGGLEKVPMFLLYFGLSMVKLQPKKKKLK